MQRLFSGFPSGFPGFGLLLLRTVVGAYLGAIGLCMAAREASGFQAAAAVDVFGPMWFLGGVLVAVGLLSPVVPIAVTISLVVPLLNGLLLGRAVTLASLPWSPATMASAMSICLALLGPGAYSVDARLFARRDITIPPPGRRFSG